MRAQAPGGATPGRSPGNSVMDLPGIRIADAGRVGPKVARLGELAQAGWRVPDGYAVTVEALAGWLPPWVREDLARLVDAGHTPQALQLIEAHPLPAWLEDAVAAAHDRLAERTGRDAAALKVAVRSSAVGEDSASASFAGQYATYLGVCGVPEVLRAIRQCWASGFSAHAVAYRSSVARKATDCGAAGAGIADHRLAVGVLELVDVRSAGVVFTMDPVTGDRGRLVVEANWGFGESVVSGQVTPDHWEVDRYSGCILASHVTAKRTWSVFDPAAGKVVLAALPAELAEQACLAAPEIRYLCRAAVEIEDAEDGVPQDVEWAIARGLPFPDSVFILQHRPETTWVPRARTAPSEPLKAPVPAKPAAPAFDPVQYALRNVFKVPGAGQGS